LRVAKAMTACRPPTKSNEGEKYEEESLNRDTLIALYDTKIAKPNSKFSHNLMRHAVDNGVLWLVKFLIKHGVPTRNLPSYGIFKHELESKQLRAILKATTTKNSDSGKKWHNEKEARCKIVQKYLIKNRYIHK